jgi:hypothetical protein
MLLPGLYKPSITLPVRYESHSMRHSQVKHMSVEEKRTETEVKHMGVEMKHTQTDVTHMEAEVNTWRQK